jgi:hypothetical protein
MDKYLTNSIIKALIERDISVTITKNGFKVEGFYKSNEITLVPDGKGFIVISRYNEKTDIEDFDDLVYLNFSWWDRSKDKYEGWATPDTKWVADMERLGYIKKETKVITEYYSLK